MVEATPVGVVVRDKKTHPQYLTAANHFLTQSNRGHQVRVFENSVRRSALLGAIHGKGIDLSLDQLFDFFGDAEHGAGMTYYSGLFGTLWTVVYEPGARRMHLRAGLDGERATFAVENQASLTLHATLHDIPQSLNLTEVNDQ